MGFISVVDDALICIAVSDAADFGGNYSRKDGPSRTNHQLYSLLLKTSEVVVLLESKLSPVHVIGTERIYWRRANKYPHTYAIHIPIVS